MLEDIVIDGRAIGAAHKPYIVAELSGNHNQSIDRAIQLIDAAVDAGADAVKLQTYTADTMTLNCRMPGFVIDNPDSLWAGRTLYDLYEEAHTPWEWHQQLFAHAKKRNISMFSSPFDKTAVDFLESLNVPAYKIASFECTDLALIRYVAATGKPLIISTGMATAAEIEEAVTAARSVGCKQLILLKCTSTYPATAANTNISTIPHLRDLFNCHVGLSDHTMGNGVSVASVALGAVLIEKHFTLDRADGGVDSTFSMEPAELRALCIDTQSAFAAMGSIHYGPLKVEEGSVQFRRSVYAVKDIAKGERLTDENIRTIRPGFGLPAKDIDRLIGCVATEDIAAATPMSWDLVTGKR
ncbi:pseudaminic acid synthase [Thalassolituus oleivorans]|uniref:pseudaminic acid synthase n=1 Tax=Thalassolituus oleivorans TaxID=187493 RepID=UPI0023EF972B|nr:pseudaminic acid synthase [Thalassolituus oleivorans]